MTGDSPRHINCRNASRRRCGRLAAALDKLEAAGERRAKADALRANLEEELRPAGRPLKARRRARRRDRAVERLGIGE